MSHSYSSSSWASRRRCWELVGEALQFSPPMTLAQPARSRRDRAAGGDDRDPQRNQLLTLRREERARVMSLKARLANLEPGRYASAKEVLQQALDEAQDRLAAMEAELAGGEVVVRASDLMHDTAGGKGCAPAAPCSPRAGAATTHAAVLRECRAALATSDPPRTARTRTRVKGGSGRDRRCALRGRHFRTGHIVGINRAGSFPVRSRRQSGSSRTGPWFTAARP